MVSSDDIDLIKNTFTFWDNLSASQQSLILEHAQTVKFEKDNYLYSSKNNCVGVIIIKSGELRAFMTSDEGREITFFHLRKNDICILTATCVLHSLHLETAIQAECDCELIIINSKIFSKITSENIHAELFTYKLATERMSEVVWTFEQILFIRFDKRLAKFLLDSSAKSGANTIHITHEQIAKYLGSAREVVSRMLKYFSKDGIVTLSRGDITIVDAEKLKAIANA